MSSMEGRAGNEDFGSRIVDDHDLRARAAAVILLQSCAAAAGTMGRLIS